MKFSEIKQHGLYLTRVGSRIVPVEVEILTDLKMHPRKSAKFCCLNLATMREIFRSARQLQRELDVNRDILIINGCCNKGYDHIMFLHKYNFIRSNDPL